MRAGWVLAWITLLAGGLNAGDLVLTVHKLADSVGFYDAASGRSVLNIPVGVKPHEFHLTADQRWLYVSMYGLDTYTQEEPGGNSFVIIDMKTRKVAGEVSTGEYRRPHGIERGRSGLFYVTTEVPAAVHILDPAKRRLLHTIPITGKKPHMLAVSEDERMAWTADSASGTVSVVSLTEKKQVAQIQAGGVPMGLALTRDGKRMFLAGRDNDKVTEIDPTSNRVVRELEVKGQPARVLLAAEDTLLLVSLIQSGEVALVDLGSFREIRRAKVGGRCEGMVLTPDGKSFYITAQADNRIHRFLLPGLEHDFDFPTAAKPDPLIVLLDKKSK